MLSPRKDEKRREVKWEYGRIGVDEEGILTVRGSQYTRSIPGG